ncbi:MAG: hypothetical protein JWN03_7858 [Nocardia sp.]|uniref:hypothetical protein n=1 Tax=Nocardia sp. TaxID=1821 RepID=UPI002632EAC9|nr:hypothetical protein [Nocardia sp.]MCU1647583.1 hypothetical protein [Nocardia sp.]
MTPAADPFADMTNEQRKRIQERITLEFVYRPGDFVLIEERERPDFALHGHEVREPFGVEITQLFPNETYARLHAMPGYMESLWDKTRSPIKEDAAILDVQDVVVRDQDGKTKYEGLPAIIAKPHSREDFHMRLAEVIEDKSGKRYDFTGFSHANLVVLDWFRMDFNASDYSTDALFNERVREALRATPFREVHLLLYDLGSGREGTTSAGPDESPESPTHAKQPALMRVPLKQLLLVEQFFAAYGAIGGYLAEDPSLDHGIAHLNRLTCDFVSRCLRVGTVVVLDGFPRVRFGASAIGLSEGGVTVIDDQDFPIEQAEIVEIVERMPVEREAELSDQIAQLCFRPGISETTHEPPSRAPFLREAPRP